MVTSYFSKAGTLPTAVSIARSEPPEYKGRRYIELAPPWDLIKQYKDGTINEEQYKNFYENLVLNELDPEKVYRELREDAVLLCWEGKGKFCHRRIVADWFKKKLNIEVPEL